MGERDENEKTSQNLKTNGEIMNTNKQETPKTEGSPRTGFYTNIMPVLGRDGETLYFFLPGEMTVIEHVNRFKGLLGIDYTPKMPSVEKLAARQRYGLHAKVRVGLSEDGQWVTVYLPGNMGRISNHINAYFHALKHPYEKKVKADAQAVA
jgi:hypothetical protein